MSLSPNIFKLVQIDTSGAIVMEWPQCPPYFLITNETVNVCGDCVFTGSPHVVGRPLLGPVVQDVSSLRYHRILCRTLFGT